MVIWRDRERLLGADVYPGMIESESRVLKEYIRRRGHAFDEFRFEVRVGPGELATDEYSPEVRKAWQHITKARPDTVGFKHPDFATIIEVKDALANDGIWQLLGYRDLYVADNPTHRVNLVAVCAYASPTARALAHRNGIALAIYAMPATAGAANV